MSRDNEHSSILAMALSIGAAGLVTFGAFLNSSGHMLEYKKSIYDLQAPVGVIDVQNVQVDRDLYSLGKIVCDNYIEKSKIIVSEDGEISIGISEEVGPKYRKSFERVCNYLNELFAVINPNYSIRIVDEVSSSNEANIYHKDLNAGDGVLMETSTTFQNFVDGNGNVVDSVRYDATSGIFIQDYCDRYESTNPLKLDFAFLHEMGHVLGLNDFNDKVNTRCSIMNYTNFDQAARNAKALGFFQGDLAAFYWLFGAKNEEEFACINSQFASFDDYLNAVNSLGETHCIGEFIIPESVMY